MFSVSVLQTLMSLCSHISIHTTTAQASPLINFALQFKKAYHNFPVSFASAPRAHKKAYLYWTPLPEIIFQREDIICTLLVSKACQHSRESTNIKVTQDQEDTSKRAMNYFGIFRCFYFCLLTPHSVTLCQATCGMHFNWVLHVSHFRLTLPVFQHVVRASQRKEWKI